MPTRSTKKTGEISTETPYKFRRVFLSTVVRTYEYEGVHQSVTKR